MSDSPKDSNPVGNPSVRYVEIDQSSEGQRLDNFLLKELKGAPKSLIYRILRKGEVRVNKKRAKPLQKLAIGDSVRIPPVRLTSVVSEKQAVTSPGLSKKLLDSILYEDDHILVIDKPSGLAVHGGSGLSTGLIESLRGMEIGKGYLELVHRLDRETSGCLILAKKRASLVKMHEFLRDGKIKKIYKTLVVGNWPRSVKTVDAPLQKNSVHSGERVVKVGVDGKNSVTHFKISENLKGGTLLDVDLDTGRTHQIRVHTQLTGHPIMGDDKYGSKESQKQSKEIGLKRLFLHAARLEFLHPATGKYLKVEAGLPKDLLSIIDRLK